MILRSWSEAGYSSVEESLEIDIYIIYIYYTIIYVYIYDAFVIDIVPFEVDYGVSPAGRMIERVGYVWACHSSGSRNVMCLANSFQTGRYFTDLYSTRQYSADMQTVDCCCISLKPLHSASIWTWKVFSWWRSCRIFSVLGLRHLPRSSWQLDERQWE